MSPVPPLTLELRSPAATAAVGEALGRLLRAGDVLALEGELGAGKTSLVRGVAAGLGVDPAGVASPTFVRLVEHEPAAGDGPWLVHVDAWRMHGPDELDDLGWGPELLAGSVVAVEWASRVAEALPADRVEVALGHAPDGGRTLGIGGAGARTARVLSGAAGLREAASTAPKVPLDE